MSFNNKVVLITGASSGIGAVTAVEFAREGAKVAIVGRNVTKLKRVDQECLKLSEALSLVADISDDGAVRGLIEKVIERFGRLDVLVNNAGFAKYGTIVDGTILASYDQTMSVNVRAQVNITALAAPYLIKSKGNIINISSVVATATPQHPKQTAYFTSKAALNHFSKCAAFELSTYGVRVNIVSPGPVFTDFFKNAGDAMKFEDFTDLMPLKRVSQCKEVSDLIMYLASDRAVGITGSEFVVDNGYLVKGFELPQC